MKFVATKKGMTSIFFSSLSFVLVFGSGIRDPGSGMGKNQGPGSGINIPDPQYWTNLLLLFYARGPTVLFTNESVFRSSPLAHSPYGRDMSRIRYSIVPSPPPPFYKPPPPPPICFLAQQGFQFILDIPVGTVRLQSPSDHSSIFYL